MALLLADEQFPLRVVELLRALTHDVLRVQDAGLGGRSDPDVLAAATAESRAVLTHDRDYLRLHRTHPSHCGIIFCTLDPDNAALASRIDQQIALAASLNGQLIRIYRPSIP
jgi:predicted nuclease of predicted toxin-antitoxin system